MSYFDDNEDRLTGLPNLPPGRGRRSVAVTHSVWTGDDPDNDERAVWECSCGHGGSGPSWRVDLASDKHIDCERGDRRIDTSRRL